MKRFGTYFWGLIFILIGVVWGLNAFDVVHINLFFKGWWTLFIIIPSFVGLINSDDKIGNIIGLVVGTFLLLMCWDVVNFDVALKLIVPTIFVLIGCSFLFKDSFSSSLKLNVDREGMMEYYATFNSEKVSFENQKLEKVSLNATFGELVCDFSKASVGDNFLVDVSSVFGSIVLYVPDGVVVKRQATSVFGKVSDNRKDKKFNQKKTITICGLCLFGGVEIR